MVEKMWRGWVVFFINFLLIKKVVYEGKEVIRLLYYLLFLKFLFLKIEIF